MKFNFENKSSLPGIDKKVNEYVNRIKKGEDKNFVLQDLGPSFISAVQEKLNQETDGKIDIFPQENNNKDKESTFNEKEVLGEIKKQLLAKVDETYTKQIARDLQKSHIENYSGKNFYMLAFNEYYKYLRTADYPRDVRFDVDVDSITRESNQLIKRVQDENGWHFRIAQTSTTANKVYARMSLNVVGNKDLVNILDKIAYRYGIYYKTPDQSDRWDERTDPITIYVNNPNLAPEHIQQLQQEVVNETKDYIRDNQGFGFYGDNISTGVEFGLENSIQEIQKVKQQAKEISLDLYEAVNEYLQKDGKEKGSVGQIATVKKIINMFQNK
jgi:hypothetical protein